MNDELETYGGGLKVEIAVKCGQVSEVVLTSQVEVEDLGTKARAKIRDTIIFLRSALPLAEIKAEDALWGKPARDPAVGVDGKLTLTDNGLIAARAGQNDLKKVLEKEVNGNPKT